MGTGCYKMGKLQVRNLLCPPTPSQQGKNSTHLLFLKVGNLLLAPLSKVKTSSTPVQTTPKLCVPPPPSGWLKLPPPPFCVGVKLYLHPPPPTHTHPTSRFVVLNLISGVVRPFGCPPKSSQIDPSPQNFVRVSIMFWAGMYRPQIYIIRSVPMH